MLDLQHAEPAEPALSTINLSKRFGRRPDALAAISLSIEVGGIVALVGPNGSGKSTLIRTWVGLEAPSSGTARVFGVDSWRNRRQAVGRIAYVPQTPALYRALTVAEHLDLARAMRRRFDRPYASDRLRELGVPLSSRADELSGGQHAQLSLAIALGTRASVLLLDEPLASLDPVARREFLFVLRQAVLESGSTCLLSSHVVTDIEESCDRVIVLGMGRRLLDDTLVGAIEHHRVSASSDRPPLDGAAAVSSFLAADRTSMTLWALRDEGPNAAPASTARRPTLEEIVVGYLSVPRRSGTTK